MKGTQTSKISVKEQKQFGALDKGCTTGTVTMRLGQD